MSHQLFEKRLAGESKLLPEGRKRFNMVRAEAELIILSDFTKQLFVLIKAMEQSVESTSIALRKHENLSAGGDLYLKSSQS